MTQMVYLNGAVVPRSEAAISPLDRGFLYGYGLFETVRSYGGRVFRLDRHLARLMRSAETLALASQLDPADLERAVYTTIRANALDDARVRLTVGAGEGERGLAPPEAGGLTVLVVAEPLVVAARIYEQGITAVTAATRRNSQSPVPGIKSLNYLESLIAHAEAAARGADEAVMLNDRGDVSECSSSNIFLVAAGRVATPSLSSGILPGVTREAVLEVAAELGIDAEERDIVPAELAGADEVFITTSVREVVPVVGIDGRAVGGGVPGETTGKLLAGYRKLVQRAL